MQLEIKAHAKINLFLEIINRRDDGFHNLQSVFQTVELADTLKCSPSEEISLTCDKPHIPTDSNNLIIQAALALKNKCDVKDGIHFDLQKMIPDGGGLGGGSSDAAAALILCNKLWNLGLNKAELAEIGAELGSDVPFFLYGEVCLCEGRGEIITPLPEIRPRKVSIITPEWKISTPVAYKNLIAENFNQRKVADFLEALKNDEQVYEKSFNRFEEAVFKIEPRQQVLHEELINQGKKPRMSGSGSCVWVLEE